MKQHCQRVLINVRGTVYETKASTLSRFPNTLLGSEKERSKYFDKNQNAITLDRDCEAFETILFYYQSGGILAKPSWISLETFVEECRYYKISEDQIAQLKQRETGEEIRYRECIVTQNNFRSKAWLFLEYPESSLGATIYSIIIFILIMLSLAVEFALTIPQIKSSIRNKNDTKIRRENLADNLLIIEMLFQVLFAAEFLSRVLFCPNMLRFFISTGNIVDSLAIFPYFLNLSIYFKDFSVTLDFLRVLRTFRVLRMFRISKTSRTLTAVISILRNCCKEFLVLIQCIVVVCVFFGSIGYYTEQGNPNTQFTSIPESMWWALQTVVCLGYGDIIPSTLMGKFSGSWVAIVGAVTLTVPLVSIGGKYMFTYTKRFSLQMGRDMKLNFKQCHNAKQTMNQSANNWRH